MTDPLVQPVKVPRDRWNRPLIIPPGGKPGDPLIPYTRVTTYIQPIKDTYALEKWKLRTALLGAVERPDLVGLAAAHRDDKRELDRIVEQLTEAGRASAAANRGTMLHRFTEKRDRGEPLGTVPVEYRADLEAYSRATECLTVLEIERFCVHDGLQVGGTPDGIVEYGGRCYIADKKTGSIDWPGEMAMQLAIYSRSMFYDPTTGARTMHMPPVSQTSGIIIHLPAGTGTCRLYWINIQAGWDAVQLVAPIKAYRKLEKQLTSPLAAAVETAEGQAIAAELQAGHRRASALQAITLATDVSHLTIVWHVFDDVWTDELTEAAKQRKAYLLNLEPSVSA